MGRPTHLTPLEAPWKSVYPDAVPPWAQLARFCAPLLKAHPPERVASELEAYLRATPPEYVNLSKFAMTFGRWAQPKPTPPTGRHYETSQEYAERTGNR